MRIGIFFGGSSGEREVSFAGGRTIYDNLDKEFFTPVPIFVDSNNNFILLDWQYIYKGTIRDFYPPRNFIPVSSQNFQIYVESLGILSDEQRSQLIAEVGRQIFPEDFKNFFDFAFLALHGPQGEDGTIQGLLEWYGMPYSGCGILPSAIGISKNVQRTLMSQAGFEKPKSLTIERSEWQIADNQIRIFNHVKTQLGLPVVVKAPSQGSSIGVSVVKKDEFKTFVEAINKSFFIRKIPATLWENFNEEEKIREISTLSDPKEGLGLPVFVDDLQINLPDELLSFLEHQFSEKRNQVILESHKSEELVLIESFIEGREFSCIVIQDENGRAIALPPTEIIKTQEVFDYRAKYLPGIARKETPIDLPPEDIERIRKECERLFHNMHCNVYARIDGFFTKERKIILNDPNTTSGMLPSSFFFHQAAEIGLDPSHFLTYIIRTSLAERIKSGGNIRPVKLLLQQLDGYLISKKEKEEKKICVAVIMGGFSSERHISVESGRNIYEKLASSEKYAPLPIFLTGSEEEHLLYRIPVNIMLKDNADDIKKKIQREKESESVAALEKIIAETKTIREKYAGNAVMKPQQIFYKNLAKLADVAFIALHGRPGEDGEVQKQLEHYGVPYNGSNTESSAITINKYETNELLAKNGVKTARHLLIEESSWINSSQKILQTLEQTFGFPFIAKPADDGCSSAVKKIKNKDEFRAFAELIFRKHPELSASEAAILHLSPGEEFPRKKVILIEELIIKGNAYHFLEVTGGLLTHHLENGEIAYEIFEPSEALASGDVLSLEEKFLAGQGQNITPARFAKEPEENKRISKQVRGVLEKTAKILNVEGYARIDAFVHINKNGSVETTIIEVNSLPGMTPATCIFHQTALNGYKPYDFIDAILEYGMSKKSVTAGS